MNDLRFTARALTIKRNVFKSLEIQGNRFEIILGFNRDRKKLIVCFVELAQRRRGASKKDKLGQMRNEKLDVHENFSEAEALISAPVIEPVTTASMVENSAPTRPPLQRNAYHFF